MFDNGIYFGKFYIVGSVLNELILDRTLYTVHKSMIE